MTAPTTPTPGAPPRPDSPEGLLDRILDALERLGIRRRSDDRWLGGICSAIATRLGVDPVIVRVGTIVATLFTGLTVIAYILAYLLFPAPEGASPVANARAKGTPAMALLIGLGVLCLFGIGSAFSGFDGGLNWWSGVPVAPILIVVGVLWLRRGRGGCQRHVGGGRRTRGGRGGYAAPPPPPSGTTAAPHDAFHTFSEDPPAAPVLIPPTLPAGVPPPPVAPTSDPAPAGTLAPPVAAPLLLRPRHRRLGLMPTILLLGLAAAAYGVASAVARPATDAATIGLAAALGVVGLGLVIVGALGRKGGLAVVAGIALLAATLNSASGGPGWGGGAGDRVWAPTEATTLSYSLGAGDARLDLTKLPVTPAGTKSTITARVNVGHLTITVPRDRTVSIDSAVRVGNIELDGSNLHPDAGPSVSDSLVLGTGTPAVVVDARVSVGTISIERS